MCAAPVCRTLESRGHRRSGRYKECRPRKGWLPRPMTSFSTAAVNSRSGSPAVMNGISALRFSRRRFVKSLSIAGHRDFVLDEIQDRLLALDCAASVGRSRPRPCRRGRRGRRRSTSSLGRSAGQLHRLGDGVRAFQGRQDAFGAGQGVEGGEGVLVAAVGVGARGPCLSNSCVRDRRRDSRGRRRSSGRRRSGRLRPASRS